MNHKIKLLGLVGIGVSFFPCLALSEPLSTESIAAAHISAGVQAIMRQAKVPISPGIVVRELPSERIIFSRGADQLYAPASTQKVFTAVAALYYLKKNYQFSTQLLIDGPIKNHILQGNVIIKFSGDPTLAGVHIKNLLRNLKKRGIFGISGRIYFDSSDYNIIPYPPGWMWDDLSYSYAAPIQTIIVDHNQFVLHLIPSKATDGPPQLMPELPSGIAHFKNSARTTPQNERECPLTIYSDVYNNYHVSGCINRAWGKQQRTLAIRDSTAYAKVLVKQVLEEDNIQYHGPITVLHRPYSRQTRLLAQHDSLPLHQLVKEMLKISDNLIAESLLKKLGQLYYNQTGSFINGLRALQNILQPTRINFKANKINDGSGLSRYNLMTPRQFSRLLSFAYKETDIRPYLLKALPVGNTDGTLISRMAWIRKQEHVIAKTGSMAGVSALVGYMYTRSGRVFSFVIMINGFVGRERFYSHLEDQICEYLARHIE